MGHVWSFLEKAVYWATGKQHNLLLQHSSYREEFYSFNLSSLQEGRAVLAVEPRSLREPEV